MRHVTQTIVSLCLCLALTRVCIGEEKPFFPLTAWDDVRSEDTIQKMAECGVNLIAFVPPQLLDACEKHGVKAIVFDPRVTPAWDKPFSSKVANDVLPEIIEKYNDHPAVFGYHLKDEPDGGQFAELAKSAELVRKLAPGKWPYINLTPGMGDGYIKDHLQPFVDQCKPPILSYDNYADRRERRVLLRLLGEHVGRPLGRVEEQAPVPHHPPDRRPLQLPRSHGGGPAAADLRRARLRRARAGLSTSSAASRSPCSTRRTSATSAGRSTSSARRPRVWEDLRNINRQVLNLAPTLLKLRSDDVYHVGEIPERNHGVTDTSLVTGLEAGHRVCHRRLHARRRRLAMGDDRQQEPQGVGVLPAEVSARTPKSVRYVSPVTGELKTFPAPWYALAPGQGVLLKLD